MYTYMYIFYIMFLSHKIIYVKLHYALIHACADFILCPISIVYTILCIIVLSISAKIANFIFTYKFSINKKKLTFIRF